MGSKLVGTDTDLHMEQITRFVCFVLCASAVACKSKNEDKTWRRVNDDNTVTLSLANHQNVQSYTNFQTFQSRIYYNTNIERQLYRFMENLLSNVQDNLFSRISPQNFYPYFFIIPKFANGDNSFHDIPNNLNPNQFQTPVVPTSIKPPNRIEPFTTNRPQTTVNRQFQVHSIPTLQSRTIVTKDNVTPASRPGTKISPTTDTNTESTQTTTITPQEASTTLKQEDDKGQFFDDEDDTTRPIILQGANSFKSNRRLDKKLRKIPEVEHGSVQAGI